MDETNLFGQRIYELRKQKQLNQKQLGEAVGLSHKAISTIESGTRGTTIGFAGSFFSCLHRLPPRNHRRPRLEGQITP